MDSALFKVDEERVRHAKRVKLRELNAAMDVHGQSQHVTLVRGVSNRERQWSCPSWTPP